MGHTTHDRTSLVLIGVGNTPAEQHWRQPFRQEGRKAPDTPGGLQQLGVAALAVQNAGVHIGLEQAAIALGALHR